MSSLIFVAVAMAWAVYLVPKALEHHDESLRSRTVATFSHTMRVLARREAATSRTTKLVPGTATPRPATVDAPPVDVRTKRTAKPRTKRSRTAASRRRTVLLTILVLNIGVAVAAGLGYLAWAYQAAPAALLVAWLVACRLMVRRARAVRRTAPVCPAAAPASVLETEYDVAPLEASAEIVLGDVLDDDTTSIPASVPAAVPASDPRVAVAAQNSWDPVNVPLPTYVSKPPAARRTVRTIDLDSTGVWSSGRSESDSALVAEADAAARDAKVADAEERRATGS